MVTACSDAALVSVGPVLDSWVGDNLDSRNDRPNKERPAQAPPAACPPLLHCPRCCCGSLMNILRTNKSDRWFAVTPCSQLQHGGAGWLLCLSLSGDVTQYLCQGSHHQHQEEVSCTVRLSGSHKSMELNDGEPSVRRHETLSPRIAMWVGGFILFYSHRFLPFADCFLFLFWDLLLRSLSSDNQGNSGISSSST